MTTFDWRKSLRALVCLGAVALFFVLGGGAVLYLLLMGFVVPD